MKTLVLGGTGFIGRRLVENLLKDGCDVTIATSGRSPNPFRDSVTAVTVDRFDPTSMEQKLSSPPYFDAVFDQIGFGPRDVQKTSDFFKNRTDSYVFVSSAAVYAGMSGTLQESAFDPLSFKVKDETASALGYSEGKKNAEAYLFQNATFPVAAARFPNVMGFDDSTLRFQKHALRIMSGAGFSFNSAGVLRNYVWVEDAGRFLSWLGKNHKKGAYNAASPDALSLESLLGEIGKAIGKDPLIKIAPDVECDSSYYRDSELVLSVQKAESEGFRFTPTAGWLASESRKAVDQGGSSPNSTDHMRWIFEDK